MIGKRVKEEKLDYLVRWAEKCHKEPCWLPVGSLQNVMELVSQFEFRIALLGEQVLMSKEKELVYNPEVVLNDSEQFRNQYEP